MVAEPLLHFGFDLLLDLVRRKRTNAIYLYPKTGRELTPKIIRKILSSRAVKRTKDSTDDQPTGHFSFGDPTGLRKPETW